MKILNLERNKLKSADDLSKLINLTDLDLSYNQITSIDFISKLTNLKTLNLSKNEFQDKYDFKFFEYNFFKRIKEMS